MKRRSEQGQEANIVTEFGKAGSESVDWIQMPQDTRCIV
jgi:hypothetical protein